MFEHAYQIAHISSLEPFEVEIIRERGPGREIDFFNEERPEGIYIVAATAYFGMMIDGVKGLHPTATEQTSEMRILIQRTSSFVDVEGVLNSPDYFVQNPNTVTVGRPASDNWGEYIHDWTIYRLLDDGTKEYVISGGRSTWSGINDESTPMEIDVSDRTVFTPGRYIVTNRVEERTMSAFPDDDITAVEQGAFEITGDGLLDPTITKVADRETVFEGEYIEYTITVTNPNENAGLDNLVVVDRIRVDLVEFIAESLRVDGQIIPARDADNPIVPSFTFEVDPDDENYGILRVYLDEVLADSAVDVTFNVRVRDLSPADEGEVQPSPAPTVADNIARKVLENRLSGEYVGFDPLSFTRMLFDVQTPTGPLLNYASVNANQEYFITNPDFSIEFNARYDINRMIRENPGEIQLCNTSDCLEYHAWTISESASVDPNTGTWLHGSNRVVSYSSYRALNGFAGEIFIGYGEREVDYFANEDVSEGIYFLDIGASRVLGYIPDGLYVPGFGYGAGIIRQDMVEGSTSRILINIQRAHSFVDIEGGTVREDGMIVSPDTVTVGRPDGTRPEVRGEADVHGQTREIIWTIYHEDGTQVLFRTFTSWDDYVDVSDWRAGTYTVRVEVIEYVHPNFPDDDIRSVSYGQFYIPSDSTPPPPPIRVIIPNTAIVERDGEELDRDEEEVEVLNPTIDKQADRSVVESFDEYIQYTLTVTNPNTIDIYDFLVIDNLANGALIGVRDVVVSPDFGYTIESTVGTLRVYLETLPAGESVEITFYARVAPGTDPNAPVVNTAYLYGPADEEGDRSQIDDDDAEITLEVEPQPTEPPTIAPTQPTETEPVTTEPTQPTETQPATTDPVETTTPETTVPETTVPATTDATEPETTAPETTVPETTCPEEEDCPIQPTCPEQEECSTDPIRLPSPRPTEPNRRPNLPQTGAIAGTALLSGAALAATGLALTAKKKKQDK